MRICLFLRREGAVKKGFLEKVLLEKRKMNRIFFSIFIQKKQKKKFQIKKTRRYNSGAVFCSLVSKCMAGDMFTTFMF
jgi:hypothetical protein